jgi:hypothetical protein
MPCDWSDGRRNRCSLAEQNFGGLGEEFSVLPGQAQMAGTTSLCQFLDLLPRCLQLMWFLKLQFFAHLTVIGLITPESMYSQVRAFADVLDSPGVSYERAAMAALAVGEALLRVRLLTMSFLWLTITTGRLCAFFIFKRGGLWYTEHIRSVLQFPRDCRHSIEASCSPTLTRETSF